MKKVIIIAISIVTVGVAAWFMFFKDKKTTTTLSSGNGSGLSVTKITGNSFSPGSSEWYSVAYSSGVSRLSINAYDQSNVLLKSANIVNPTIDKFVVTTKADTSALRIVTTATYSDGSSMINTSNFVAA